MTGDPNDFSRFERAIFYLDRRCVELCARSAASKTWIESWWVSRAARTARALLLPGHAPCLRKGPTRWQHATSDEPRRRRPTPVAHLEESCADLGVCF